MRPLLALLFLLSVGYAQTFSGHVGFVTIHRAEITLTRTASFAGWYEFVPGLKLPITGRISGGWFRVDGWFETRVKMTGNSILGDGVWLWRK